MKKDFFIENFIKYSAFILFRSCAKRKIDLHITVIIVNIGGRGLSLHIYIWGPQKVKGCLGKLMFFWNQVK